MDERIGTATERASAGGQFLPNGMLEDYPRSMWWVAARADEITSEPFARWILELPIVLYRTTDSTPAAPATRPMPRHRAHPAPLQHDKYRGPACL